MKCLVTVIMPCYNSSRYIGLAIKSVLNQTISDWELIVVDDCSLDNSADIVNHYAGCDSRVRLIKLPRNRGAAIVRNIAIRAARGRYIAFLDSDDLFLPDKLEKQIHFMKKNNVAFSYSAYEKVDQLGNCFGTVGVPNKVSYKDLLKVCSIGCLTAIYDSENLGKIYMPLIRRRQDLGLWLQILKKIPYAYATPGILAQYRVRGDSISANKRVAAHYTWKVYREIEKLSIFKAAYYFSHYAVNGLLRTKFPRAARLLGFLK